MVDTLDSLARSRNMAKIRGKDTKPEIVVRKYLFSRGLRYRLHDKKLAGKPDLVLPKFKVVILVHGCFWHRHKNCRFSYIPKTRLEFWEKKFQANVARDTAVLDGLQREGWRVIVIWECAIRSKDRSYHLDRLYEGVIFGTQGVVIEEVKCK